MHTQTCKTRLLEALEYLSYLNSALPVYHLHTRCQKRALRPLEQESQIRVPGTEPECSANTSLTSLTAEPSSKLFLNANSFFPIPQDEKTKRVQGTRKRQVFKPLHRSHLKLVKKTVTLTCMTGTNLESAFLTISK